MKKHLITGLIILLPVALTGLVAYFIFDFFSAPFFPVVKGMFHRYAVPLPEPIIQFLSRIISLILLCIFLTFIGMLTQYFFFKNFAKSWDHIIRRIPLVNTVYIVCSDFFNALISNDGKRAFKETVMVPFAHHPHYALGLLSGEVPKECQEKVSTPLASVFSPTAPHPISGFLFLVPKDKVHKLDMTKEDAFNYLVSCGVIHPAAEPRNDPSV